MAWQWYSLECVISDIKGRTTRKGLISFFVTMLLLALIPLASANITVSGGEDLQLAIDSALPGDTIAVGPGIFKPITIDRPLTITGCNSSIQAGEQLPAIAIRADKVTLSGFDITGIPGNDTNKFDYYIRNSEPGQAAAQPMAYKIGGILQLNMPNAAIVVDGSYTNISDIDVDDAEVGLLGEGIANLRIANSTFNSCELGIDISHVCNIEFNRCSFVKCSKGGLKLSEGSDIQLIRSNAMESDGYGIMIRNASDLNAVENVFDKNMEGLALWNVTNSMIDGNLIKHNYYGILLSGSNNNTLIYNRAEENSRSEIVSVFGVGISLQDNSSYNIIMGNKASGGFIGIEATKGTMFNVISGNEIKENRRGVRVDKNSNNLIYNNNFVDNMVSATDNLTVNVWNTSRGNYYSDYKGVDSDKDGIGDKPYTIPTQGSDSPNAVDYRPLMKPYVFVSPNTTSAKEDLEKYVVENLAVRQTTNVQNGVMVINSKKSYALPNFKKTASFDLEKPKYIPNI